MSALEKLGKDGPAVAAAAAADEEDVDGGAEAAAVAAGVSFLALDDAEEAAAALFLPRPWGAGGDGDGEPGDSVGERSTWTTMAEREEKATKGRRPRGGVVTTGTGL